MMSRNIHYTKPSITEKEIKYATDAAANGWGNRCYEYIVRFEKAFAAHLGVRHAIATSSCTGALHMGLSALGIGPGDEVIMADTNWIATAAPIVHLGAKPVFVDVREDSWCIDPDKAHVAVTSRTKAIIAVHLYGNACEMDELLALGREHGIPVVEDAAEAIGTVYHGRKAGSLGVFGGFSFHGTKTLTTGEGGMFVTNDTDLYERVLTLSNHGRKPSQKRQFWPEMVGFKYKISNVQAAIGLAQLERVEELISRKREILAHYRSKFSDIGFIAMNPEPKGIINGAWMPTIILAQDAPCTIEDVAAQFHKANIDARVFFHPLSSLPMFNNVDNANARSLAKRGLNLPSYHDLTSEEQETVSSVVLRCIRKGRETDGLR